MRPSLSWSQFNLKTLMLAVVAAGSNFALASQFLNAPFLSRLPAPVITLGMLAFGVFMPSLWVGTLRRLTFDGLLAQIAGVCTLWVLLVSTEGKPSLFFGFISICLGLLVFVPSIAWYVVARSDPGEARENIRRWTIRYSKNALQLAFGFVFFCLCFMALRSVVG